MLFTVPLYELTNCVVMQRRVFIQTILFSETRACVCAWGVDPVLPVQPADLLPLIQSQTACVTLVLPPTGRMGLCVMPVPPTGRMGLCVMLVPPPTGRMDCLRYACLVLPSTGRMGLLVLRLFCLRSHPFVMLNSA